MFDNRSGRGVPEGAAPATAPVAPAGPGRDLGPAVGSAGVAAADAADAAGARLDRVTVLAPGPLQIGLLAVVDPDSLDHAGRVELLQAWERASRWVTARQLEAVVAVAGPTATNRDDFAREDVRVALREAGGSWRQDVDLARSLRGRLATAGAALAAGSMSYPQARALEQETEPLDDAAARAVCDRVLADGRTRTPADFRRRVRAAVIAVDPIGAALRGETAAERRRVVRRVLPDGQASLELAGPATAIAGIWAVLTRRAGLTHLDDTRTLDQRRFDAMLDICRSSSTERDLTDLVRNQDPGAGDDADCHEGAGDRAGPATSADGRASSVSRRARKQRRRSSRTGTTAGVFLFADVATWSGLADNPVDLDGYGPIPPGMARECFTDSQWRAVVTDALTGLVASVSDTSYTPSPRTRRHIFAQDRGCLFPGCSAPVWYCDTDHSQPHDEGGCTDPDNCGLLCRRHHRLKTFTGWTWKRHGDGTVAWTSPDGRVWTRPPQRYHQLPVQRRSTSRIDARVDGSTDPRTGPAPTRAGPDGDGPGF
jgi:hypothetical protein